MAIAFQPNAFQSQYPGNPAFQGFNRAVFIRIFGISEFLSIPILRRTSLIPVRATVIDPGVNPPIRFNPDLVEATLYNPSGILHTQITLNNSAITGEFIGIFQTDSNDPLGIWTMEVHATSTPFESLTGKVVVFKLEA
jgi:hypothetical protein